MENTAKMEIIQKIINSNKIVGHNTEDIIKTKISYMQSFLLGWLTEEDLQWVISEE